MRIDSWDRREEKERCPPIWSTGGSNADLQEARPSLNLVLRINLKRERLGSYNQEP